MSAILQNSKHNDNNENTKIAVNENNEIINNEDNVSNGHKYEWPNINSYKIFPQTSKNIRK